MTVTTKKQASTSSSQTPVSSLSNRTDSAFRSEAVLELGKRLVTELGLDEAVDTLSRWMAHHIAELIHQTEIAPPQEIDGKQKECRAAILELWKARRDLPNERRPLRQFEPVLRALESLDPTETSPRYFRPARPPRGESSDEDAETKKWLDAVEGIDYSARVLISYCLGKAAESAAHKERKWVELARKVADDSDDNRTIRVVMREAALTSKATPDESEQKALKDRMERLESFIRLSALLHEDFRLKVTGALAPSGAAMGDKKKLAKTGRARAEGHSKRGAKLVKSKNSARPKRRSRN